MKGRKKGGGMHKKTIWFAYIAVICILLIIDFPHAKAEDQLQSNMPIVREALRANKKLFIAENMDLTVKETNEFWSVYDSFQKNLEKIITQYFKLIEKYAQTHKTMSDEDAVKILNARLNLDTEHVKLSQSYLPRFYEVLPGKKVTRYYQLESKFFAVVEYDLAARIPLLK